MKVRTKIGRKLEPLGPNRRVILKRIEKELQMVYQWSDLFEKKRVNTDYSYRAFEYMYRAEALIELLEIHDCGSTGGFDGEESGLYSLEERLALLKRK